MTEMNTYPEFPKGCRTLPEMLEHTAATWPDRIAYQWFDRATEAWASITWKEFLSAVRRWQKALKASGLKKGDRVAVLLTNSIESLLIDQSVLACGMTPVPMHAIDTPSACAFVLSDSGARALVTASEARWHSIRDADPTLDLSALGTVVLCSDTPTEKEFHGTPRVEAVTDWLAAGGSSGSGRSRGSRLHVRHYRPPEGRHADSQLACRELQPDLAVPPAYRAGRITQLPAALPRL